MPAIAPFRFDVTPPLGHALLGGLVQSAKVIDDSLEGIGYVLVPDDHSAPVVICALDWAGLCNASHLAFRQALAAAARTTIDRVAVQCVHQHNAPFVCEATRRLAAAHPKLPPAFDPVFFNGCLDRAAIAVRTALPNARTITHVGHGSARVDRVAANRRVNRDDLGRVQSMRGSSCQDQQLTGLPEGVIDPRLQTIALYAGDQKVVASHYYATHPMSYYNDGRVTADFCGLARRQLQTEEPDCTHIYFTGCAGNLAAGKYNDGSPTARASLTQRMLNALREAQTHLNPEPLNSIAWSVANLAPTARSVPSVEELGTTVGGDRAERVGKILQCFWQAWASRSERGDPLPLSSLTLNDITALHLPAEVFIEYQLHAQSLQPGRPIAVAAYGDGGPWYIPTAEAYPLGGYETQVAFSPPSIDLALRNAIAELIPIK